MPKRKKRSLAQEAERVAVALQKLVRLKASDENGYASCVTCGKVEHYKYMDGGHFMERGRTATKLTEENIHPQCKRCNMLMGKGCTSVALDYRDYMVEMYGEEFIEELRAKSREVKKWDRWELEDMYKEINEQIKELEDERHVL